MTQLTIHRAATAEASRGTHAEYRRAEMPAKRARPEGSDSPGATRPRPHDHQRPSVKSQAKGYDGGYGALQGSSRSSASRARLATSRQCLHMIKHHVMC